MERLDYFPFGEGFAPGMNGRSTDYPAYNAGARPAIQDGESIKFTAKNGMQRRLWTTSGRGTCLRYRGGSRALIRLDFFQRDREPHRAGICMLMFGITR